MLDGAAKVKLWVFEIRIVYDDVRRVSRTALMQVHDLARHITTLVLRLDCCLLIMTSGVAPHGPRNSHLEWRLDPNTKVPRIGELDPLQKHTVEKKDGIRGCCLIRQVHRPIISVIKTQLDESTERPRDRVDPAARISRWDNRTNRESSPPPNPLPAGSGRP